MRFERIAITGAGGFLGRALTAELERHCELHLIDARAAPSDARFIRGDVCSLDQMRTALRGCDAIVHTAALVDPGEPAERLFTVNTIGTWNVLQAGAELGARRVVLLSSECAVGIMNICGAPRARPHYLPVDESHPLRPNDAYGLSKQVLEDIGRGFADRYDLSVICLRPTLILDGARAKGLMERRLAADDPDLWSYVELGDVVRAAVQSLEVENISFERLFLSASDTFADEPTLSFMERLFGALPEIRDRKRYVDDPHAAIWDTSRAHAIIGFHPTSDWRRLITA